MTRRLVVHIGDCKTGSTSIQDALAHGTLSGLDHPVHFPARRNHIPISRAFDAGDDVPLIELLSNAEEGVTILSAEHFEFVDAARLAKVIGSVWSDDLTVIGYVRPHAEALYARYCENVKIGNVRGSAGAFHATMLKRKRLFYAPRFGAWKAAFGSNFMLRPFAQDYFVGGDVVSDFLKSVFGPAAEASPKVARNRALSVEALALQRMVFDVIGRDEASKGARTAFGRNLARSLQGYGKIRPQIEQSVARDVARAYAKDARATDALFFEGTPMQDALAQSVETAVQTPHSLEAEDYFSSETREAVLAIARTLEPLFFERPGTVSNAMRSNFLAGRPSEDRIKARLKGGWDD